MEKADFSNQPALLPLVALAKILKTGLNFFHLESYLLEDKTFSFEILFLDEEEIRSLNQTYRSKDKSTDVLSFPSYTFVDGQATEESIEEWRQSPEEEISLGSIAICIPIAARQAQEYQHSFYRELCFLCVHSFLHLLGFDHEIPKEAERMESLQEELLASLSYNRDSSEEELLKIMQAQILQEEKQEEKTVEVLEQAFTFEDIAVDLLWYESEIYDEVLQDVELQSKTLDPLSTCTSKQLAHAVEKGELKNQADFEAVDHFKEDNELHTGFVSIVGRANAGKSTLLNRLIGETLAIVSRKAQTTRHNIKAVYEDEDSQIIFLDTPGLHEADSKLGERMNEYAWHGLENADLVVLLMDAHKLKKREFELQVLEQAKARNKILLLCLSKCDTVPKESLLPFLEEFSHFGGVKEILPISSKTGDGITQLLACIKKYLPVAPRLYPKGYFTDQTERQIASELIREQILTYCHQEIPHGTAVMIDKFEEKGSSADLESQERRLVRIFASILCEKESHKGMIIGKKGEQLKRIASAARKQIEALVACKVYLEIHVKVRADWKNQIAHLDSLGYKKAKTK